MAVVNTDIGIWLDGYDLSGQIRGVSDEFGADMLDKTTYGSGGTRQFRAGLNRVSRQIEGLWDASGTNNAPDKQLFDNIGVTDTPFSVASTTTEGDTAYTFQAAVAEYTPGGSVGELISFSANGEASGNPGLVRGQLIFNKTGLASSGNGTAFQVGALAAGQSMYAALHVTAAGTGTFDGILQSDDASGFASPTTRITFTQATGVTSEWASVAGAVADDWWRLNYTIAGGAPSFSVALVIGIL